MHVPTIQRTAEPSPWGPAQSSPGEQSDSLDAVTAPLAGQVVAGTLLTVITLGIYRFWYKTALRRYYWRNTRLAGDGFEYTGTGRELFVGFLIALAIVVPIYLAGTLVSLFGGQVLGPTLAGILGVLIMPAVVQILSYRARRYRLTRTRYRGVQFHQSGSGTAYLLRTIGWLVLTMVTLGIAFPFFRRALERYKIENTWFGSAQGSFESEARPLLGAWMALWVMALVVIVLFGGLARTADEGDIGAIFGVLLALILAFTVLPFLWIRYRVHEFRTFTAGTRFGVITFASTLTTGAVTWIWIRYYLALFGLMLAFGGLMAVTGGLPVLAAVANPLVLLGLAPVLLIAAAGFLVALALVTELVFRRPLWALRVRSVTVNRLDALDAVVQQAGLNATGIGEAFDTGFDVAG
ncbi:DUF898 family protein [Rhabdaerophilum sp. SD176]|uniref:DUF898 family protein n=1 Tax=Rhabdaerophilum sp. SD176 TaxID=2983548 RepID=UPI0024DFA57B|nr:DUF898 family protein [Rhabdaerophilum sp. SD176]